jgi:hypothetical protein
MEALPQFLEELKQQGLAQNNLLGLLHLLIGRRITRPDGTIVTAGLTWREAAALLKKARWDKDAIAQLNLNLDDLPPRDRERFWYTAIARARVDSDQATAAGEKLAGKLRAKGYAISPPPQL